MREEDYWRDFMRGNDLKKYKVKTVKKFTLDRWQIEDIYYPKGSGWSPNIGTTEK